MPPLAGRQPSPLTVSTQHLQGAGLAVAHRSVQRGSHPHRLQTRLGAQRAQQGTCVLDAAGSRGDRSSHGDEPQSAAERPCQPGAGPRRPHAFCQVSSPQYTTYCQIKCDTDLKCHNKRLLLLGSFRAAPSPLAVPLQTQVELFLAAGHKTTGWAGKLSQIAAPVLTSLIY